MTISKVSALNKRQRTTYIILVGIYAVATIFFWAWWFGQKPEGNTVLYWLKTWSTFYIVTFLPSMYCLFVGFMKKPQEIKPKRNLKVAMMTLTVPGSESIEIVERQLKAMVAVKYPHDSWILVDKVHSPEIKELADKYNVHYFCRHQSEVWGEYTETLANGEKGSLIEYWNQPIPPYQAKTKAGNVNACLNAWRRMGYAYDVFTQLDIDHNPKSEYLEKVLGYFKDKNVAWVQAPSVYNNTELWTARGSVEQEVILQGPLQMGWYGLTDTPMIIGSHSTYRLSAIEEIGGFQPTRAEDHLDTLYLAAKGYKGVFVPEPIAWGDGPENFSTYLSQQFAWAFSMFQVLMAHTPKMFGKLSFIRTLQFLFAQTWYPLWSTSMLFLFFLPALGMIFGTPISKANFYEYMLRYIPLIIATLAVWVWSSTWFQPKTIAPLTWRSVILYIARWPLVLSAIIQALFKVKKPYMITSKGVNDDTHFALSPFIPFIFLSAINVVVLLTYLVRNIERNDGEVVFLLLGNISLLAVVIVPLLIDIKELAQKYTKAQILKMRSKAIALNAFLSSGTLALCYFSYPRMIKTFEVIDIREMKNVNLYLTLIVLPLIIVLIGKLIGMIDLGERRVFIQFRAQ